MSYYAYVHARPETMDATGIFYVGKGKRYRSTDFSKRNKYHAHILDKYGCENILIGKLECSTEEFAFELERGLIKTLKNMGVSLVNTTDGGEGVSGYKHTEEACAAMKLRYTGRKASAKTKEKMRVAHTGENNHFFGRSHSEESKVQISEAKKGCRGPVGAIRSEQTRKKISDTLKGQPGRPHTEETIAKMSLSHIGRKYPDRAYSEETRSKLKAAADKRWAEYRKLKMEKTNVTL